MSENLSPIYQIVYEKFLLKNPEIYKELMYELINDICQPVILQFLITVIFLSLIVKSWNLHKLHKLTSSFNFLI